MDIRKCAKERFSVIGKEGSTADGEGFVQRLWADANAHFQEVRHLAKEDGVEIVGVWGCMSDVTRSFQPWDQDFGRGLYLAGIECLDDAEAPDGWTKWQVPGFEYLCIQRENDDSFREMIAYLRQNAIALAGAVQDFTNPKSGKNYMLFPIRRL